MANFRNGLIRIPAVAKIAGENCESRIIIFEEFNL